MTSEAGSQMLSQQTALESASSGSQTILETQSSEGGDNRVTLRLRAPRQSDSRRIQWAEDVVDNEGMGKKSSKVCCIYHKPGEDESDSDDSSSSSEDDDEPDLSRAQRAGGSSKRKGRKSKRDGAEKEAQRRPSPNAYERQPKNKNTQAG